MPSILVRAPPSRAGVAGLKVCKKVSHKKDSGTRSGAWHMHQTCNWGAAPSRSVLPFDGIEGRSVCWARRPWGRGRNALKPSALVQDERQRIVRSVYEGSEHAGWSNIMSDVGSLSSARIALQHVTFPEHERMLSPRAQQTVHSRPSRDCGSYCGITPVLPNHIPEKRELLGDVA